MESLGVGRDDLNEAERREIWTRFARSYYLFRGTPSSLWLQHVFYSIFRLDREFNEANASYFYDTIKEKLASPAYRPRALFDRFKIEVLATTDAATETLDDHAKMA
jgi:glucuronate isomerase